LPFTLAGSSKVSHKSSKNNKVQILTYLLNL
jgi:hypothetical protein